MNDGVLAMKPATAMQPVKFFSKLNYYFFGYFHPINIFFDNKYKYFSG